MALRAGVGVRTGRRIVVAGPAGRHAGREPVRLVAAHAALMLRRSGRGHQLHLVRVADLAGLERIERRMRGMARPAAAPVPRCRARKLEPLLLVAAGTLLHVLLVLVWIVAGGAGRVGLGLACCGGRCCRRSAAPRPRGACGSSRSRCGLWRSTRRARAPCRRGSLWQPLTLAWKLCALWHCEQRECLRRQHPLSRSCPCGNACTP